MTTKATRSFNTKSSGFKLSILSTGHFFNDLYAAFLPTFIPGLVSRLGISMAQAGFFSTFLGVIHIFVQPVVGYISDRSGNPWLIIWGPIFTCIGATLIPLSPSYGTALFFVGVWAIGSSMFHPQGHSGVGHVVPGEKLTISLAFFSIAGTLGTTMSPLFAVALVNTVGINFMPVAAVVPVIVLGLFTWKTMPRLSGASGEPSAPASAGVISSLKSVLVVIYPLLIMSTVRDMASQGVRMFFPLKIAQGGAGLSFIGTVLFLIMVGSSAAMLVISRVADRHGKKKTLTFTMAAASVFLFAGRAASGWAAIFFFALGTAAVNATMPITAAIAQELIPNARGIASSIVMGLSWGLGNMMMAPFGKVGDLYGVDATLLIIALLPLFSLPLVLTRPFREVEDRV